MTQSANGRILHVAQRHPNANDQNPGTLESPFLTLNRAAELAMPGETIRVHAGIYRERVDPQRGGTPGAPITYEAALGEDVFLRGSDEYRPVWQALTDHPGVFRGAIPASMFGLSAYAGHVDVETFGDCNPYKRNFNRNHVVRPFVANQEVRPADTSSGLVLKHRNIDNPDVLPTTLGQVFVDGKPLTEVQELKELYELPGTWCVDLDGENLLVHFPESDLPKEQRLVEIATRHTVFAPLTRALGYITVRGFTIEHGANHFPCWGDNAFAQIGILSTRSGHHWVIEGNTVRYAKSVGIDCGSEGRREIIENRGPEGDLCHKVNECARLGKYPEDIPGNHIIRDNHICDNGHCGLTGIGHYRTQVLGNVIERNNRTGYTSPYWEFAGIKFHQIYDGLIEGNLVRDNEAHGIWIDNQWRGTRVTRNIILNNLWSGLNVELGRGPALVDNNIIAYTRQGNGIYGHDLADVTFAHNLLYANANFGFWFSYCTPRVKPEDGCWDLKIFNNLILGNRVGAIGYPIPYSCGGRNVSNGNLFMGGGEYLDEGSKASRPLFQVTNKSHMGQEPEWAVGPAMTPDHVAGMMKAELEAKGVPESDWPNFKWWKENFLLPFELWKVLGHDANSGEMKANRDGLQSRNVSWQFDFDENLFSVKCEPVPGVDKDFRGQPYDPSALLPGPFQKAHLGRTHITLWPVRGIRTTQLLE